MHNSLLTVPLNVPWTIRGVIGFLFVIVARKALLLARITSAGKQAKIIQTVERRPNGKWVNQRAVKTSILGCNGLTPVWRCVVRGEDGWAYMVSQLG